MKPSAKIILDSISEQGHRLTTMEVVMHRFILAEMNTHRVFSRNSASSRAIPFHKAASKVQTVQCYPVYWGSEHKGMQSGEEIIGQAKIACEGAWDNARIEALDWATELHKLSVHKSLCNRLLEPFMWHTAIITATEWDNFFWQRCHPDAQPEMKAVADEMQRAYYTSTPKLLVHGEWHCPYIRPAIEIPDMAHILGMNWPSAAIPREVAEALKQVSTARCARVSYLTQDGKRDLQEDLNLFERLKGSGHWSPFEHVATPARDRGDKNYYSSNFIGWKQFRKEFVNENRANFIPNLPDLAHIKKQLEENTNAGNQ